MSFTGKFGDPKTERDILSAKRFNFFSLIVLVLAIAAAFVLYLQLIAQQRELEVKTQQLADSTANLRRIRSELEAAQQSLAKREQTMENQLVSLSNSVEKRQFDSAMVKATAISSQIALRDSNGLTFVNIYGWKPKANVWEGISKFFSTPEYVVVKQEVLPDLPAWMGTRSTIYYYSKSAATKAESMAKTLSKRVGSPFEAKLADHQEAPKFGHHESMHIHYLGSSLPRQE